MEHLLTALKAQKESQRELNSEFRHAKENLLQGIEYEFDTMATQLQNSREMVQKMVSDTFDDIKEKLRASEDVTRGLIREVEEMKRATSTDKDNMKNRHEVSTERYRVKPVPKERNSKTDRVRRVTNEDYDSDKEFTVQDLRQMFVGSTDKQDKRNRTPYRNEGTNQEASTVDMRLKLKRKITAVEGHGESSKEGTDKSDLIIKRKSILVSGVTKSSGIFHIKTVSDLVVSNINCICCPDDGQIILVDTDNKCLKILQNDLGKTYKIDHMIIKSPFSICHLRGNEFVLTGYNGIFGSLDYVSISGGELYWSKGFSTGIKNWSVVSNSSYVYVLSENKRHPCYTLRWYDFNGGSPNSCTIQGQNMCFNSTGSLLYVTMGMTTRGFNKSDNVHVFKNNRKYTSDFEELSPICSDYLKTPCGVAVDQHDQVYVLGYISRNILQFDQDGRYVRTVCADDTLLPGAKTLGYDKKHHRLVIAGNSDKIQIINLNQWWS